jgi:hypothetical protein
MPAFSNKLIVLSFFAAASVALSPAPALAQPDATSAKAEYRKAYDAMARQEWLTARELLLAMWNKNKTYDVASSLGQVEFRLQHYAAAAKYMTFANANVPPSEKTEFIKKLQKGLQEVRILVGSIRVVVNEPGAELRAGDQAIGQSPLNDEVFLDPGTYLVTATKDGRTASQKIVAKAGESFEVSLNLPPAERGSVTPGSGLPPASPSTSTNLGPTAPPSHESESSSPSLLPAVIGGGVALVALTTGIGFRVAANGRYDDAEALREKNGPQGCADGTAPASDCAAQNEANKSGDRKTNVSTVAFSVAGAALVGTAVYWFWPRSSATEKAGPRVQGTVGQGGGFLTISGNF